MKSTACLRSSVIDMEAARKSNFLALRAGMMPSQSEVTTLHSAFILAHSAWAISTSKPTTWPLASIRLKGG
ncbi:hypothetical protein FQZ97_1086010 [compost metagenome]